MILLYLQLLTMYPNIQHLFAPKLRGQLEASSIFTPLNSLQIAHCLVPAHPDTS